MSKKNNEKIIVTFEKKDMEIECKKTIEIFLERIKMLIPGRLNANTLLDMSIKINDNHEVLKKYASVSNENNQLKIKPFDHTNIHKISNGLLMKDIGSVSIADACIYLTPQKLTEEVVISAIKNIKNEAENQRIIVRNIRKNHLNKIDSMKNSMKDLFMKYSKDIQDITDKSINEIDKIIQTNIDLLNNLFKI